MIIEINYLPGPNAAPSHPTRRSGVQVTEFTV